MAQVFFRLEAIGRHVLARVDVVVGVVQAPVIGWRGPGGGLFSRAWSCLLDGGLALKEVCLLGLGLLGVWETGLSAELLLGGMARVLLEVGAGALVLLGGWGLSNWEILGTF